MLTSLGSARSLTFLYRLSVSRLVTGLLLELLPDPSLWLARFLEFWQALEFLEWLLELLPEFDLLRRMAVDSRLG
jgi:hypothetical protein